MKYQIIFIDDSVRDCSEHVFYLNKGDSIRIDGFDYEIESKMVDYDEKTCDVTVGQATQ